jgi:glycosyltransferase involved in cell wall biosynthesis
MGGGARMSIDVIVPVYRRAHRVQPLIQSFNATNPDAHLLFVASPEDREELAALEGIPHLVMPLRRRPGDWAAKINYGYRETTDEWILACGDDVHFHPKWDERILLCAERTGKRVIGTSDMNPRADDKGIYSPHPAVHRSYADELGTVDGPGEIMCERYDHNYPDRELAATAIARGEWAFCKRAILEHLHPAFSKTPPDATYRLGMRNFGRDGRLFRQRSKLWQ